MIPANFTERDVVVGAGEWLSPGALSMPTGNHLFIAGTGRSTPTEYRVPGHVAEQVVRDIASWVGSVR